MNIYFRYNFVLLLIIFCAPLLNGQKSIKKQADLLFNEGLYSKALPLYAKFDKIDKNAEALLNKAICEYHTGLPNQSISSASRALDLNSKLTKAFHIVGLAQLDLGKYKLGADILKQYLASSKSTLSGKETETLIKDIRRCEYAQRMKYTNSLAFVENMGANVNTEYDEKSPVQSPTIQSKYYFSSNRDIATGGLRDKNGLNDDFKGRYYFDMFAVELVNGNWTSVYPFNSLQNSSKHEIIQDFSRNGDVMIYTKSSDLITGTIYVDTFQLDANQRIFPTSLSSPIFGEIGDKDISVFKDNIILFASKRDGGFGGYDLYMTVYNDSLWSKPVNLGPSINSEYNEIAPYLTRGGNELYYSSDRLEGFGGYDIYVSKSTDSTWLSPQNLGLPINSSRDDKDIFISFDGTQAIFSSNRPNGFGGYDLYLSYWQDQVLDQLAYTEDPPIFSLEPESMVESSNTSMLEIEDIPKRTIYINKPLFYIDDNDLDNPQNIVNLNNLSAFTQLYPDTKVELHCHTNADNLRAFNLFFGLKRGEAIRTKLINKGINPENITVKSYGDSYPMVSNSSSLLAQKHNARIDVILREVDSTIVEIITEGPPLSKDQYAPTYFIYQKSIDNLVYRIKVGETSQIMRSNLLSSPSSFMVEKVGTRLHYYMGEFATYLEAVTVKNQLLQSKSSEMANIVPFVDGKPIEDTNKFIGIYPDLSRFIEFEK